MLDPCVTTSSCNPISHHNALVLRAMTTIQQRTMLNLNTVAMSAVLDPLLKRIFQARGIDSAEALNHRLSALQHYRDLKDIDCAAELLAQALWQQQRVMIVGDYDCDGATSTALAVLVLRQLGAQVDYLVPNRFEYGYGLTPDIVALTDSFAPNLLITVDNGIASIAGVAAAKAKGMQVIITDHHLAADELPDADAIINPNQPDCLFPSKAAAGVAVIFYVMSALRAKLREQQYFTQRRFIEPNLAHYLDLVAVGSVADLVPLDHNNRILVKNGLDRIRAGQCRRGITALIEVARKNAAQLSTSDLGFAIGPRLNAAGRLDDMRLGIELLLTDDPMYARQLAFQLDGLNQERKVIEASMKQEAFAELQHIEFDTNVELPWGITLFQPSWHQGVIGILASRIKDKVHRPVIAFAEGDDGELKGSARSISGFHIRDALAEIDRQHPQLIIKFGGHAMAAGLTIQADKLDTFTQAFDQQVRTQLNEADLQAVLLTDGELSAAELNLVTAHRLREAAPWGQGFPEPRFEGIFHIEAQRLLGDKHLKLMLRPQQSTQFIDAVCFNIDTQQWPNSAVNTVRIVYKLDINEYQQKQSVQLLIDYIEPFHV